MRDVEGPEERDLFETDRQQVSEPGRTLSRSPAPFEPNPPAQPQFSTPQPVERNPGAFIKPEPEPQLIKLEPFEADLDSGHEETLEDLLFPEKKPERAKDKRLRDDDEIEDGKRRRVEDGW
jgi:hypothetical protein